VRVAYQVGDPQVFERERIRLAQQPERRPVVEVASLALHLLVLLGQESLGSVATVAALLAARDTLLGRSQRLLRLPGVP